MKRTEIERRQRELRRVQKKDVIGQKRIGERSDRSVGAYINELVAKFCFGDERIFNLTEDIHVLEVLEDMKVDHPEKWQTIVRKAVKKTGVRQRQEAINELLSLAGE